MIGVLGEKKEEEEEKKLIPVVKIDAVEMCDKIKRAELPFPTISDMSDVLTWSSNATSQ